jgi:hypothetical protein
MSHDKIKAAARKRMAETGEPYAAAGAAGVICGVVTGPVAVALCPVWAPWQHWAGSAAPPTFRSGWTLPPPGPSWPPR